MQIVYLELQVKYLLVESTESTELKCYGEQLRYRYIILGYNLQAKHG